MRSYTYEDIADLAYNLLPNGRNTSAPIDIEHIILSHGIRIREDASLGDNIIGKITFENDSAIISINPNENIYRSRRRFTLAHELGHFILHSRENKREFIDMGDTMFRSEANGDFEKEANHFAACILMPEGSLIDDAYYIVQYFEKNLDEFSEDEFVRRLALKFNVSIQSMRYRLINLDILSPEKV